LFFYEGLARSAVPPGLRGLHAQIEQITEAHPTSQGRSRLKSGRGALPVSLLELSERQIVI
jgi:hypothetical protein